MPGMGGLVEEGSFISSLGPSPLGVRSEGPQAVPGALCPTPIPGTERSDQRCAWDR